MATTPKRKRAEDSVDLTLDVDGNDGDESTGGPQATSKRARVNELPDVDSTPSRVAHRVTPTPKIANIPTTETLSTAAPPTSPGPDRPTGLAANHENERKLHDAPKIADRYVPRCSTAEGMEYTNPRKVCLKPAYWKPWSHQLYTLFADHLRLQFDPIPFSKQTRIPVDEVRNVFSALVCNPLYSAKEATRRGEEGMREIMEAHRNFTTSRPWGVRKHGEDQIFGDLSGVGERSVVIARDDGSLVSLTAQELNKEDVKYLARTLSKEDKDCWKQTLPEDDKAYLKQTQD